MASQTRRSMELGGRPAISLVGTLEERFGVKVFFDDLGDGESAACVRAAEDAAILMNRKEAPWRQRFSFAHELFHLLTWDAVLAAWPTADTEPIWSERIEKLANAFAAALLVPAEDLRGEFQNRFGDEEPPDAELVDLARSYGVSTEALLWRLKNLSLVPEETVRDRLDSADFRRLDRASMAEHWSETPEDLPKRFVRLVALAYQAGEMSRSVAAEYLEKNPGELYYLDWDEENGWPGETGPT